MIIVSLDWDKIDDTYNQQLITFPRTVTWIASEAGLASNADNWSGGVTPRTGDEVIFDATSVNNCLWDLDASEVTVNSITIATGYTGTVTQGDVDIGIGEGGYLQQSGTMNGNSARYVYCAGNLASTGGEVIETSLNVHMTREGAHITSWTISQFLRSLVVYSNITIDAGCTVVMRGLVLLPDAMLDIQETSIVRINPIYYSIDAIQNQGAIIGHGTMLFTVGTSSYSIALGKVDCPVTISLHYNAPSNRIVTLSGQAMLGSSLRLVSTHVNNNVALDLNGHSLTASSITVGARGAIVGDGTIINGGDLDTSAGSFSFTGQYVQAGDGIIKLAEGQKFNELLCIAPTKLASDIIVDDILAYVHPIDKGAFNITNDRTKEYTGPRRPFMMPLKRRRLSNPSYHSLMEFIWYD